MNKSQNIGLALRWVSAITEMKHTLKVGRKQSQEAILFWNTKIKRMISESNQKLNLLKDQCE